MSNNRELNVPTGLLVFNRKSLEFLRIPTWEEWQQVMEYLSYCRKTSLRWIADARRAGRKEFGDEAVEKYEQQLELDMPDLKAAEALEGMEARHEALSDEHHWLVAKRVDDPEKQREWLEVAEKEDLSPRELAASISANRVVRTTEQEGRSGGIATIEGVRGLFDLWAKPLGDRWRAWPAEKQERLLKEILPIVEMGNWLRESLAESLAAREEKAA